MKKINLTILLTTVLILLIFPVINHELTHAYIYQKEGCKTNITFIPKLDLSKLQDLDKGYLAATYAKCPDYFDRQDYHRLDIKQTSVEASGYQIMPLYWFTAVIFVFIWLKTDNQTDNIENRIDELETLLIKLNKDNL